MMAYARWSLKYVLSIALLCRAALLTAFPPAQARVFEAAPRSGPLGRAGSRPHVSAAPSGCASSTTCTRSSSPAATSTGRTNPYALAYDRQRIERNFPSFRVTRTYKSFVYAPSLPVHRLSGESLLAWYLWAHL